MSRIQSAALVLRGLLPDHPELNLDDDPRHLQFHLARIAEQEKDQNRAVEIRILANLVPELFAKVLDSARVEKPPSIPLPLPNARQVSVAPTNPVPASSRDLIPTLSVHQAPAGDNVVRASTLSLVGGLGTYALVPALGLAPQAGRADEIAAVGVGAALGLFSSIMRSPVACDDSSPVENGIEVAKGVGGGLGLGATVAALTPAALFSLVDGGIMLATTLLGGTGAALYRKTKQQKKCPGIRGRQHVGDCSQRVCRKCFALFVPDPKIERLDCAHIKLLNWYQVASYLQYQGLSHLDSLELIKEHLNDWKLYPSRDGSFLFGCREFISWVEKRKDVVAGYVNSGAVPYGQNADEYLCGLGV